MGARSGACVGGLGWTVVLSTWSFSSLDVLGRDLVATRVWLRGAQLSPMKWWNGAPQTAARSASISVVSEKIVAGSKVGTNFERGCCGDVQRRMGARTDVVGADDARRPGRKKCLAITRRCDTLRQVRLGWRGGLADSQRTFRWTGVAVHVGSKWFIVGRHPVNLIVRP